MIPACMQLHDTIAIPWTVSIVAISTYISCPPLCSACPAPTALRSYSHYSPSYALSVCANYTHVLSTSFPLPPRSMAYGIWHMAYGIWPTHPAEGLNEVRGAQCPRAARTRRMKGSDGSSYESQWAEDKQHTVGKMKYMRGDCNDG
jgi:hypothetical protein